MSFRFGGLRCDLCLAELDSREDFDKHMAEEHGTVSLKPRSVVKRAGELLDDLARITGRPLEPMTLAEAEANITRYREEDQRRQRDQAARRELADDIDRAILKRSLKTGWLTFRAPAGAADGMVVMPIQMGEVPANFVYHKDGSWLQFETQRQRDKYVEELGFYVKFNASRPVEERLEESEIENMKRFIHFAEKAKPWTDEDLPAKKSLRFEG